MRSKAALTHVGVRSDPDGVRTEHLGGKHRAVVFIEFRKLTNGVHAEPDFCEFFREPDDSFLTGRC